MKVSIFRVEKPCGTGPYVEAEHHPMLSHMYAVHGDADHPEPWDDPVLDPQEIYPEEQCGFATLPALEEWFAGYEDPLDELGYRIVSYTLPLQSVRFGLKQALFLRKDAVQGRTMPISW